MNGNPAETAEKPAAQPYNRFKYEEFAGPAGEQYLEIILQQILPTALWRTWHWAISFQPRDGSRPLYVSASTLADRTKPGERKIYLDIAELERRGLLRITPTRLQLIDKHTGKEVWRAVTIKDFERLYDLAHEYHEWLQSPAYIPASRDYLPVLTGAMSLIAKLVRFDNYRRIILCAKPGRKPKAQWYSEVAGSDATGQSGTSDLKVNLYLNTSVNKDSPKRFNENPSKESFRRDSFESDSSRSGNAASPTRTSQESLAVACSPAGYTKDEETKEANKEEGTFPATGNTRNSQEDAPEVKMAQQAMAIAGIHPKKGSSSKYQGDGKPRPQENEMVSSFVREIGPVLGDRNAKGSNTAVLRQIQASNVPDGIDTLMVLVRAYTVARDTKQVRPEHRHPDGDNRMPVFIAMVKSFCGARGKGSFVYTEANLIAHIDGDERLRAWLMERGYNPTTAKPSSTAPLAPTHTAPTHTQTASAPAPEAEAETQTEEVEITPERTTGRTKEQREARAAYAKKVRRTMQFDGAAEMPNAVVEHEHIPCGNPLYYDTTGAAWAWKCAKCHPHPDWDEQMIDLVESILDH